MIVHMIVPYLSVMCHHLRLSYSHSKSSAHATTILSKCLRLPSPCPCVPLSRLFPFEVLSLFWCKDSRVRVIPPRAVLRPSCVCLSSNVRRLTRGRRHVIGRQCSQQIGGLPATVEEPACMYCTCSRTEDVPCAASSPGHEAAVWVELSWLSSTLATTLGMRRASDGSCEVEGEPLVGGSRAAIERRRGASCSCCRCPSSSPPSSPSGGRRRESRADTVEPLEVSK
jgi:hypothetical protein